MKSMFLVRSEHLNHQGHLFGGHLMAEIDTIGFCLLRESYRDKVFVTRAAEIDFERPARLGDVITLEAQVLKIGVTSIQVRITGAVHDTPICTATVVYVNVGPDEKKKPLNLPVQ